MKEGEIRLRAIELARSAVVLLRGGAVVEALDAGGRIERRKVEACKECGLGPAGGLDGFRMKVSEALVALGMDPRQEIDDVEVDDEKGFLGKFGEAMHAARSVVDEGVYGLALRVRAFHHRFGHAVRTRPTVPTKGEMQQRLSLISEEYLELLEACGLAPEERVCHDHGEQMTLAAMIRMLAKEVDPRVVNLADLADAMADLDYVVEGTRAVCGIRGEPIAADVHEANMRKVPVMRDGSPDPLAKPLKPDGWSAPDATKHVGSRSTWHYADPSDAPVF